MPVTFSFDIETASVQDGADRTRIQLAFLRFGWEHIGGSSWRYPALNHQGHASEDWFNHVIPALMYFRALVEHSGMVVTKMTLDAHSEAGYRGGATPVGQNIQPAANIQTYPPNLAAATEAVLSDARLREFVRDTADSLA